METIQLVLDEKADAAAKKERLSRSVLSIFAGLSVPIIRSIGPETFFVAAE